MQDVIFNLFLISWEVLCCKLFVGVFSKGRRNRQFSFNLLITITWISAEYIIAFLFRNILILKILCNILVSSAVLCLFYHDKLKRLIILTLFYEGVGVLSDYIAIIVLGKLFTGVIDAYSMDFITSMMISIVFRIVLLLVILLVKRIVKSDSAEMLTDMEWMRLLIVPVITIASIIAIVQRFDILKEWHQDQALLYIALGMAVMNINIFYLVDDILIREKKIREGQLYKEQVKNETQWYYSISQNLDKQRQMAHEYKNHTACIAALVQRREYDKLEAYLQKMEVDMVQEMDIIDTNHVIVNAILNIKYKEIRDKGIIFVLKVNDLAGIWLDDKDIVVLLTNLLSNAVEACESCKERKVIKLKIVIEDEQLIVAVHNSISKSPVKEEHTFLTTKEEALQEHGYGIKNIIEVVDKYDGQYVIDYDEQEFLFSIIFSPKQG